MKNKDEILMKFDEAIQYFIDCSENLPGTKFSNNVDRLINIKCDIANEDDSEPEALHIDSVSNSVIQIKNILSSKLVNIAKKHVGEKSQDVPNMIELLNAIDVIEKYCG